MTIDAANAYYERLLLALDDLNKVFTFNREVNAVISIKQKAYSSNYIFIGRIYFESIEWYSMLCDLSQNQILVQNARDAQMSSAKRCE